MKRVLIVLLIPVLLLASCKTTEDSKKVLPAPEMTKVVEEAAAIPVETSVPEETKAETPAAPEEIISQPIPEKTVAAVFPIPVPEENKQTIVKGIDETPIVEEPVEVVEKPLEVLEEPMEIAESPLEVLEEPMEIAEVALFIPETIETEAVETPPVETKSFEQIEEPAIGDPKPVETYPEPIATSDLTEPAESTGLTQIVQTVESISAGVEQVVEETREKLVAYSEPYDILSEYEKFIQDFDSQQGEFKEPEIVPVEEPVAEDTPLLQTNHPIEKVEEKSVEAEGTEPKVVIINDHKEKTQAAEPGPNWFEYDILWYALLGVMLLILIIIGIVRIKRNPVRD